MLAEFDQVVAQYTATAAGPTKWPRLVAFMQQQYGHATTEWQARQAAAAEARLREEQAAAREAVLKARDADARVAQVRGGSGQGCGATMIPSEPRLSVPGLHACLRHKSQSPLPVLTTGCTLMQGASFSCGPSDAVPPSLPHPRAQTQAEKRAADMAASEAAMRNQLMRDRQERFGRSSWFTGCLGGNTAGVDRDL